MHDAIYEHQQNLNEELPFELARKLGLDGKRFSSELESGIYRNSVNEDFMSGVRSGVNGTAAFFVNGSRFEGARNRDILSGFLKAVLEAEET